MMVISRPRSPEVIKNLLSHLLIQELQIYHDLSERGFGLSTGEHEELLPCLRKRGAN